MTAQEAGIHDLLRVMRDTHPSKHQRSPYDCDCCRAAAEMLRAQAAPKEEPTHDD